MVPAWIDALLCASLIQFLTLVQGNQAPHSLIRRQLCSVAKGYVVDKWQIQG